MLLLFALGIGTLAGCGTWLLLRARTFDVILGLTLVSYAVNLFIFAMGRVAVNAEPILRPGTPATLEFADPLPQSLVLTAIVIGFALICFAFILVVRVVRDADTDSAEDLRFAEPVPTHAVEPPASPEGCDPQHPDDVIRAAHPHDRAGTHARTSAGGRP